MTPGGRRDSLPAGNFAGKLSRIGRDPAIRKQFFDAAARV
jgi:hypothetical protein